MKFKNIEAFLAVAENLNFSKAAEQLGCSQSAVTMQIKELENELGALLFERMNKSVKLTAAGGMFLRYAQKVSYDTNALLSRFSGLDPVEGSLRIAVWQTLNMFVLPDILEKYCLMYPKVDVTLLEPAPGELYELLAKNGADFAYLVDDPVVREDVVQFSGKREELCFVASPGHPLAGLEVLTLAELAGYDFLLTARGHCYHAHLLQELKRNGLELRVKLESGNTEPLKLLAERGAGIAYLPRFAVDDSLRLGRLTALDVVDCRHCVYRQVIYHKNKWLTPAMRAMIDLISETEGFDPGDKAY